MNEKQRSTLNGLGRLMLDVDYNVSRSEVRAALAEWRRAPERRRLINGMVPRGFYRRVYPDLERNVVAAHRRVVLAMYRVEPGLGRLVVRRAGRLYAESVIEGEGLDSLEEAVYEFARRGIGLIDYRGCRGRRCVFRFYDCITCSGIEGDGRGDTLCEWEAGVVEAVIGKLLGAQSHCVRETRCWNTGYTFCEFLAIVRG